MLNFRLKRLSLIALSGIRLHGLLYVHSSFFTQREDRRSSKRMGFIQLSAFFALHSALRALREILFGGSSPNVNITEIKIIEKLKTRYKYKSYLVY